jgi:hypothetical protein
LELASSDPGAALDKTSQQQYPCFGNTEYYSSIGNYLNPNTSLQTHDPKTISKYSNFQVGLRGLKRGQFQCRGTGNNRGHTELSKADHMAISFVICRKSTGTQDCGHALFRSMESTQA